MPVSSLSTGSKMAGARVLVDQSIAVSLTGWDMLASQMALMVCTCFTRADGHNQV